MASIFDKYFSLHSTLLLISIVDIIYSPYYNMTRWVILWKGGCGLECHIGIAHFNFHQIMRYNLDTRHNKQLSFEDTFLHFVIMECYCSQKHDHMRAGIGPSTQSTRVLSCQRYSPLTPVSGGSRAAYTTASTPLNITSLFFFLAPKYWCIYDGMIDRWHPLPKTYFSIGSAVCEPSE